MAKSGAMVKALRQQLEEAKAAQVYAKAAESHSAASSAGSIAASQAEADAKQALQAKQALEREVTWLKDRTRSLQAELDAEKAKARAPPLSHTPAHSAARAPRT